MIINNSLIAKLCKVNGIILYPFIFLAPKNPDATLLNHELIHWSQIKRWGVLRFYFLYLREYVSHRRKGLGHSEAYRAISFEQEAYANQENLRYLERFIS